MHSFDKAAGYAANNEPPDTNEDGANDCLKINFEMGSNSLITVVDD